MPEIGSRRSPAAVATGTLGALAFAALTFLYRFNALGGALGGFDDDHFPVLARAELVLGGQLPLRDFADVELRGAWPPLSYLLPAWVQQAWGRNLLSEAYFTVGVLAFAAAATFVIARAFSRSWLVATLAALTITVSGAEMYNFPKVLVLVVAVPMLAWLLHAPSLPRIVAFAGWTAVAGLFRHDYAVYLLLAAPAGLMVRHAGSWRAAARSVAVYVAATVAWLLPSLAWVQYYAGIPSYVRDIIAATRIESATRSLQRWPAIDPSGLFGDDSLVAVVYYAFWAVPAAALLVLALRARGERRWDAPLLATGVSLAVLAAVTNHFFLRANLSSRFGDAAVPIVLLLAWLAGRRPAAAPVWSRASAAAAPPLLLALLVVIFFRTNSLASELRTAGLTESPRVVTGRFRQVQNSLRRLPPERWTEADATDSLRIARYVAECTAADDYLLMGGYATTIPVYAHRRFAAGQAIFALGFYQSDRDQQRALERLRRQSAPIAIVQDPLEDFQEDYPIVWRHLDSEYREAGTIDGGDDRFHVFVERRRVAAGTDAETGLPCLR